MKEKYEYTLYAIKLFYFISMKLSDFLADLFFPPLCCHCEKTGSFLCEECFEQLYFFALPVKAELEEKFLDSIHSAVAYESVARSLVRTLKYGGVKNVAPTLARLLYFTVDIPSTDLITAVPLHPKKQRLRGYNQAEEIARELSVLTQTPYLQLLKKNKYTSSQVTLTHKSDRLLNLKNSFLFNYPTKIERKTVLIIDDVLTTGTTLNECAQVLKAHGATSVVGLTVAHGH